MNRPVNREQIAAALQGLPFTLSEHDEGGGITVRHTGNSIDATSDCAYARAVLLKAGVESFALDWYRFHIASPDVAGQPMLSGGVSQ